VPVIKNERFKNKRSFLSEIAHELEREQSESQIGMECPREYLNYQKRYTEYKIN